MGNERTRASIPDVLRLVEHGDLERAHELCLKIRSRDKGNVESIIVLAMILERMGNQGEMERQLRNALKINPNLGVANYNLGRVLAMRGRYEEAAGCFRRALKAEPGFIELYVLLAEVYSRLNKVEQAIAQLEGALRIDVSRADVWYKLGGLCHTNGEIDKAIEALHKSVSLKADSAAPYHLLHYIYYEEGKYLEAKDCYERLLSFSQDSGTKIRHATMAPIIMESEEEIVEFRAALTQRIDSLLQEELTVDDPLSEIRYTNFQLAYHGHNDKPLQVKLAELYRHACPGLEYASQGCYSSLENRSDRKIRIGIISSNLGNHSIGKAARGLIGNLSRDRFHVTVFFFKEPDDAIGTLIKGYADKSVVLESSLGSARRDVEKQKVDILFYQDIGMDPVTYFLAFSRLAPVQCTYFGHPVTTGIPNMDYFISTDLHEPVDMRKHYSEQVVLLKDVAGPSYNYKPDVPPLDTTRERFGFAEGEHIYFSPQTLYKFHPAIDPVLADILREDPQGRIVLKVGRRPYLAELLRNRFEKTMADVSSRITFIPQLSRQDYFSMIALSDVMLDTIHFGGFTTTIDAIAVGTPVITWPGEYMRGRHTMSFYKKMGVEDCIADDLEDYATKAVNLAADRDYNQHLREKMSSATDKIWEEKRVIREYERVFEQMLASSVQ